MKTKEWLGIFDEERAISYDDGIPTFIPGYLLFNELILDIVQAHKDVKKVLIIGAGTGFETVNIAKLLPEARVCALDPSAAMLNSLEAKKVKYGLNNVQIKTAFLEEDDEQDYDLVIANLVMHFIEDNGEKENFMKTVFSKMSENSHFFLVDKMKPSDNEAKLEHWYNFQIRQGKTGANAKANLDMINNDLNRITEERLNELGASVGFQYIHRFFQAHHIMGFVLSKIK